MGVVMAGLSSVLFGADVIVKQYMEEQFDSGEERELIPGMVVLRKVYNKGFCLDFLDEHPALVKGASAAVGIVVVCLDTALLTKKGRPLEKLGMSLLTAGAASNIFDRLIRGKVIDYIGIKTKYKKLNNITFNLADVMILLGGVISGTGYF